MNDKVKVIALKPFFGSYGKVKKDDTLEISKTHLQHYTSRGLVAPETGAKNAGPAPSNKMMPPADSNKGSTGVDPLADGSQTGGPAGEEKLASSSQVVPASTKAPSPKPKASSKKKA